MTEGMGDSMEVAEVLLYTAARAVAAGRDGTRENRAEKAPEVGKRCEERIGVMDAMLSLGNAS